MEFAQGDPLTETRDDGSLALIDCACGSVATGTSGGRTSRAERHARGNFGEQILDQREDLLEELSAFYGPEDAAIWLDSAQSLLDGAAPMQRVREGKVEDVEALIDQLRSGAYV